MTTSERSTLICTFESRIAAEQAMAELNRMGFRDEDIGFAMRGIDGNTAGREDAASGGTSGGEGAAGGILAGAGVGGVLGALASGLIPGVGPVLAGGILASTLAGATAGGVSGGLMGWLSGLGIPDYEDEDRRFYESEFEAGRPILTVRAPGRYQEAMAVLSRYGSCGSRQTSTTMGMGQTTSR